MEIDSNWLFDYDLVEDISAVHGGDVTLVTSATTCFTWPPQPLSSCFNASVEIDWSPGDREAFKESGSRKRLCIHFFKLTSVSLFSCPCQALIRRDRDHMQNRLRSESCIASGAKACREKLRRDRLNERFVELGYVLEPGRPPKADKAAILSDAVRTVTQLRSEAQKLKESNEDLQEKIKELKAEKNELRDEKQRLKADKEKLEQQLKAMSAQASFLPHPSTVPAAFGAQGQGSGNKLMPFMGYPGIAMWQFIPPSVRDTSQDHVLRPPVA
ncbi:hypothetical protein NMG60_11035480 [Bertholletia excelsa]